jgi:hypothetical protein
MAWITVKTDAGEELASFKIRARPGPATDLDGHLEALLVSLQEAVNSDEGIAPETIRP